MAQDDESNTRSGFNKVCCKLMIFALGFICCSIITALSYFTYQSVTGKISICTPWTDIPGRLVIFMFCYYGASICGCLPIPRAFLLECLPEPFLLWKIGSWRKLARKITLPSFSFNFFKKSRNPETAPLLRDEEERFYDCLPREESEPADIIYPENYVWQPASQPIQIPNIVTPEKSESQEESFMSFDSPRGGHIVPMAKRKSSRSPYLSESGHSPGTSTKHLGSTPPRTPEDLSFPEYPHIPWDMLTRSCNIPDSVKGIHKKNILLEDKEYRKYIRRQFKEERRRKAGDDYESSDSYESEEKLDEPSFLLPLSMRVWKKSPRPTRLKPSPRRLRKTKHRKQKKTTSDASSSKQAVEESRSIAAFGHTSPQTEIVGNRLICCEVSPTFQAKVAYIRDFFEKRQRKLQADAEQQKEKRDTNVEESQKTDSPEE